MRELRQRAELAFEQRLDAAIARPLTRAQHLLERQLTPAARVGHAIDGGHAAAADRRLYAKAAGTAFGRPAVLASRSARRGRPRRPRTRTPPSLGHEPIVLRGAASQPPGQL